MPWWALCYGGSAGRAKSDNFPPVDYTGALDNMERNLKDPKRRAMMESDALYEVERQGGAEGLVIAGFPDKALVGKTLGQVSREKKLRRSRRRSGWR